MVWLALLGALVILILAHHTVPGYNLKGIYFKLAASMQPAGAAKSLRRSFSTTVPSLVSIIPDALPIDINSWSCADVVR